MVFIWQLAPRQTCLDFKTDTLGSEWDAREIPDEVAHAQDISTNIDDCGRGAGVGFENAFVRKTSGSY